MVNKKKILILALLMTTCIGTGANALSADNFIVKAATAVAGGIAATCAMHPIITATICGVAYISYRIKKRIDEEKYTASIKNKYASFIQKIKMADEVTKERDALATERDELIALLQSIEKQVSRRSGHCRQSGDFIDRLLAKKRRRESQLQRRVSDEL